MFNYGAAPTSDEVELTVFGPGYGEAIAVHYGDEHWMLVDSCISPDGLPASLEYLRIIGVPTNRVHTILASHWHDDHVKGLTNIVRVCSDSELFVSGAFNSKEAMAFLSAYGGKPVAAQTSGAKELIGSIRASVKPVQFSNHKTLIWEETIQGRKMRAVGFSPTPAALAQSIAHLAQYIPCDDDPIGHVVPLKPNSESVVVSIDLGGDAVLLGSDLEDHGTLGWTSIVGDKWCLKNQRASAYKISHHGSCTGDHSEIWEKLLVNKPNAVLTPFINGNVRLPSDDDRIRIAKRASGAYICSDGSRRPQISRELNQRMAAVAKNLAPINSGFGAVRFRKRLGDKDWNIELFGQAKRLT